MWKWLKSTSLAVRNHSWRGAATVLLILLVLIGFHWRLTLSGQYTWLESPDLARQVLPWYQMQVGEFQQGRIPLWDPYSHGGQPLLAQAQPGTAYPLNWLLFLMPTRSGWIDERWLNAYYVLIRFLAAFFAYLLFRDWGYRRAASVIGGVVFAIGAYVGQIDWPQMVNGAVWAPLILLFVMRSIEGRTIWGSAALGGICLGMAFLAGHHQVPIYLGLMAAGVWLWGGLSKRVLAAAALFFVIAGLVAAAQALPAWEYSKHAYRWVGLENPVGHTDRVPYWIHQQYSMRPWTIFGVIFPGIYEHVSPLVGIVAVLLAWIGVRWGWQRSSVRVASGCAAGGFLFALGADVPFHGVLYSLLPVLEKARNPAMAVVVYGLGMAGLVAAGIHSLTERIEFFYERVALWVGAGLGATLFLNAVIRNQWAFDSRGVFTAVAALGAGLLIRGLRLQNLRYSSATALLLGLIVLELGQGPVTNHPHDLDKNRQRDLPAMKQDVELVETIRRIDPLARWDVSFSRHNFGDWNGIDTYGGYLASLTRGFWDLEPYNSPTRRLWAVAYYVGKEPLMEWSEELYSSAQGWKVYRNQAVLPRLRTVHRTQIVNELSDIKYILATPGWDYAGTVFLYREAPGLEQCGGPDGLHLIRRDPNRATFYAEMSCRGMAILADNNYPGWEAWVDGRPARIWDAYGAQRGVVLDAGRHVVEMRFRPGTVCVGFVFTLIGLLAGGVIFWLDRRK